MADESADVDTFEQTAPEGDAYMDEFLDDEDDDFEDDADDDEPILPARGSAPLAQRRAATSPASSPRAQKRARRPPPGPVRPGGTVTNPATASPASATAAAAAAASRPSSSAPVNLKAPLPTDIKLRAAGQVKDEAKLREYLVANFRGNAPSLTDRAVRLYREGERTVDGRRAGLEEHEKQTRYYKSYTGQARQQRYGKQGLVSVPKRNSKPWRLEIMPPQVDKALVAARDATIERRRRNLDSNADANGGTGAGASAEQHGSGGPGTAAGGDANGSDNADMVDVDGLPSGTPEEETRLKELKAQVQPYIGSFEGKASSKFALMFVDRKSRVADVVPIGDYGWFSFRQQAVKEEKDSVRPERSTQTRNKVADRIGRLTSRMEEAQAQRELSLGDPSRARASQGQDLYDAGIRRNKNSAVKDEVGEIDFDLDFDNDDVAQVDKEMEPKKERKIILDPDRNMRDLRRLIKDEQPEPEAKSSQQPGAESDDDEQRSPSGSKPNSPSQSAPQSPSGPKPNASPGSASAASATSAAGAAPAASAPGAAPKGTPTALRSSPAGPSAGRPANRGGASGSTATAGGHSGSPGSPASPGSPSSGLGSPSPGGSSPGSGGQRLDLSHLVPPKGVRPTVEHVRTVLTVLTNRFDDVTLKELMSHFEKPKTKEEKAYMTNLLKQLNCNVYRKAKGTGKGAAKGVFYINWKKGTDK